MLSQKQVNFHKKVFMEMEETRDKDRVNLEKLRNFPFQWAQEHLYCQALVQVQAPVE